MAMVHTANMFFFFSKFSVGAGPEFGMEKYICVHVICLTWQWLLVSLEPCHRKCFDLKQERQPC